MGEDRRVRWTGNDALAVRQAPNGVACGLIRWPQRARSNAAPSRSAGATSGARSYVAASEVLHDGVPGADDLGCLVSAQDSARRSRMDAATMVVVATDDASRRRRYDGQLAHAWSLTGVAPDATSRLSGLSRRDVVSKAGEVDVSSVRPVRVASLCLGAGPPVDPLQDEPRGGATAAAPPWMSPAISSATATTRLTAAAMRVARLSDTRAAAADRSGQTEDGDGVPGAHGLHNDAPHLPGQPEARAITAQRIAPQTRSATAPTMARLARLTIAPARPPSWTTSEVTRRHSWPSPIAVRSRSR